MKISNDTNIFFINLNNLFLNLKEIKIKFSLLDNFIFKITPYTENTPTANTKVSSSKTGLLTKKYDEAKKTLRTNYLTDINIFQNYIDKILTTNDFAINEIIDILEKIKNINIKYFSNIPNNDYTNNIKKQIDEIFKTIIIQINIIVKFLEKNNLIYIEILKKILQKNKVDDTITKQLRNTLIIIKNNEPSLLSINIMLISIVELSILKYIKNKLENNKKLPSDILDSIKYNFIKSNFDEQIDNNIKEKLKDNCIMKLDIDIHLINCPPNNNFLYKTINNPILPNYLNNKEMNENNINKGLSYFGKDLIMNNTFINFDDIDINDKYNMFCSFNSLSSIESLYYFLKKKNVKSNDYNYIIPFINNNDPIKDYSIKDPKFIKQNISYNLLDDFTKFDNIKKRVIPIIILNKIFKNYNIETNENMINILFDKMKDMNKTKNNEIKKINSKNLNKNAYNTKIKNINNDFSLLSKKYNLYLFASRDEITNFYNNKYSNIINNLSYFNNISCNMNIEIKNSGTESNISVYYNDLKKSKNIFYNTFDKSIIINNLLIDKLFINNIFTKFEDIAKKYISSSKEEDYMLILDFLNLNNSSLLFSKINDIINCIYKKGVMNLIEINLPSTLDGKTSPKPIPIIFPPPVSSSSFIPPPPVLSSSLIVKPELLPQSSTKLQKKLFNNYYHYNMLKYDELLPIIDKAEISKIDKWKTYDKIKKLRITYTNVSEWINIDLKINNVNNSIKIPNNIGIKINIDKSITNKNYIFDKILNNNDFCYLLLYKNDDNNQAICLKICFNENKIDIQKYYENIQFNDNIKYRKNIVKLINDQNGNIIYNVNNIFYGIQILPVFEGSIKSKLKELNNVQKESLYNDILKELFVLVSNKKAYFDLKLEKVLYWNKDDIYNILFDFSEIIMINNNDKFTYSVSQLYINNLTINNVTNISLTYFIILVIWHQIYSTNDENKKLDFRMNSKIMICQYFNTGFVYSTNKYLADPSKDPILDEITKQKLEEQREDVRNYLNIEINDIKSIKILFRIIKKLLNDKTLSEQDYIVKNKGNKNADESALFKNIINFKKKKLKHINSSSIKSNILPVNNNEGINFKNLIKKSDSMKKSIAKNKSQSQRYILILENFKKFISNKYDTSSSIKIKSKLLEPMMQSNKVRKNPKGIKELYNNYTDLFKEYMDQINNAENKKMLDDIINNK